MPLNFTRIFNSVVTRLLVLALCIVVFGAVVRYYVLTDFLREDLSAVVEGQQLALATYVAHDIDDKIIQRQRLLELLAASISVEFLKQPERLPGLPNRHHLSGRLRHVLALAQRKEANVGLLFMDLDGFKHINDTLGHEAGDEVLRQVARRFRRVVRETDTLARIGGDEFVVLLSDLGDDAEEIVSTVATKCIDALGAPFFISGTVCIVGVSIGIALGNGESSADMLLLAADRVMYQAKKTGRGRYVTYKL